MKLTNRIESIWFTIRYNLKIIFANKFIYFLIASLLYFLVVIAIMLFTQSSTEIHEIYNNLILPGILIVFYPVIYNIQNDKDNRMLEIIFGIPDYRYKIYMVRFAISMLLLVIFLFAMSGFVVFSVARIPVLSMVFQLMFPLFFISCLSFLFTTITHNGNTTAVIMVIIGVLFALFFADNGSPLHTSKWNLFLNPFDIPSDMNYEIFRTVVKQNRIILLIGSVISLLWGLINLQQREKFV